MTSKQFLKLSFSLITSHIFEVLLYISRRSLNFKIVPSEKESIPAQKIRWSATEYIYFIFGCDYFTITTNLMPTLIYLQNCVSITGSDYPCTYLLIFLLIAAISMWWLCEVFPSVFWVVWVQCQVAMDAPT